MILYLFLREQFQDLPLLRVIGRFRQLLTKNTQVPIVDEALHMEALRKAHCPRFEMLRFVKIPVESNVRYRT